MIILQEKKDCCGCEACVQRCPKACIAMVEDDEGFLYPQVDEALCIDCGLCEKVCPVLNQQSAREPLEVFAAKNPDEDVRRDSSSGGVFSLLAQAVIARGGAVVGARFTEQWGVRLVVAETMEEIAAFRGSKYLQAEVGDAFVRTRDLLKAGREVLFSGSPCHIAGLRRFLGRDYEQLLCVDFICHGTPSPGIFRRYLCEEVIKHFPSARQGGRNTVSLLPTHPLAIRRGAESDLLGAVRSVAFRDKRVGWKKFSFALSLSKATAAGEKNSVSLSYTLYENPFLKGFLRDLYLRPSCHACPAKGLSSGSDITLGDYWGIASLMPDYDDDRGTSVVTVNTPRGATALHATAADLRPAPWEHLVAHNGSLVRSVAVPKRRAAFFADDGRDFHQKIKKLSKVSPLRRLLQLPRRAVRKVIRILKHTH